MDVEERKLLEKLERLKIYIDLGNKSVWERYKTLSTVSSLSATLLVVATFNQDLLPTNSVTKFLLTILLLLVPTSLIAFLHELHCAEIHAHQKRREITEKEDKDEEIKAGLRNYIPWIVTGILTIVILWIIFLIWNCK